MKIKLFLTILLVFTAFFFNSCGGGYVEEEETTTEPPTIETFKESLSPDGEWIKVTKEEIDPDGVTSTETYYVDEDVNVEYIWRPNPTYVWAGWNPYMNGRWVWTDCGWMWASNYNWGWATYHYGRWWWSGVYGWVWSPGFRWAPAWVSWRFADNHVGWYPLSPRLGWSVNFTNYNYNYRNENWTFVEKNNFTSVVNNTTVINNTKNEEIIKSSNQVTNIKEENNKMINSGPKVSEIEKATGKNIPQRTIQETSVKGKPTVNKNSVSVYRGTRKTISKNRGKNKNKNKNFNGENGKNIEENKK